MDDCRVLYRERHDRPRLIKDTLNIGKAGNCISKPFLALEREEKDFLPVQQYFCLFNFFFSFTYFLIGPVGFLSVLILYALWPDRTSFKLFYFRNCALFFWSYLLSFLPCLSFLNNFLIVFSPIHLQSHCRLSLAHFYRFYTPCPSLVM